MIRPQNYRIVDADRTNSTAGTAELIALSLLDLEPLNVSEDLHCPTVETSIRLSDPYNVRK